MRIPKEMLEKYAQVMFWGLKTARAQANGTYKPGDNIMLACEIDAIKLYEAIYRILVQEGFNVTTKVNLTPTMSRDFYQFANDEQLSFLSPWSKKVYNNLHGFIFLRAPASLTHLKGIDPKKFALGANSMKPLLGIRQKRQEIGEFGWTVCNMPTRVLAKRAKLTIAEYWDEIVKACYLDKDDPVRVWESLKEHAEAIKSWLKGLDIDMLHVESANTDLWVAVGEQRKWVGVSGHNIPSFEIFTSPDWRRTRGYYFANMPLLDKGNILEGITLHFKDGRVVSCSAEKGEKLMQAKLSTDKGASQLGEFSLTDRRFSPITRFMADTLFDENVGGEQGNCHIAIGRSFPDAFDGNGFTRHAKKLGFNMSVIHCDIITTEQRKVTAHLKNGGKLVIYEDGEFKL